MLCVTAYWVEQSTLNIDLSPSAVAFSGSPATCKLRVVRFRVAPQIMLVYQSAE